MTDDDFAPHAFADLTPDSILDAVESIGFRIDASLLELNSYENRVYQIGIEDEAPIIAKFYRAERWSDDEIGEEHAFSFDLFDEELSVVPPIQATGQSLFHYKGLRFSLFKRQGGRAPPVDDLSCLETLGRHIAMIHNVGQRKTFACRPTFSVTTHGHDAVRAVLEGTLLPTSAREAYEAVTTQLLARLDQYEATLKLQRLRIHGDCHMGNVLWRDDHPHFVDFDDARSGPAIQDLWMLLSGPDLSLIHI